jgi:hypothetical protein
MLPRPLDHLVLPVTDIRISRERLTALGFTVAADARHPFGTENACVFFKDKTYLEPLGIASEEECLASAKGGNQFTARNTAYRFRNGPEGLSAIVMGSTDADGDDAGFHAEGITAGDMLQFSRQMKFPDGTELTATFKLSFAADQRAPDFHAFTCERINVPPADRSALEAHPNGVTGIKSVVLAEHDPEAFADFVSAFTGQAEINRAHGGMTFATANADVEVLDADGAHRFLRHELPDGRGLRGAAVVFKVMSLAATENHMASNRVTYIKHNGMLLVPQEPGQGVLMAFWE